MKWGNGQSKLGETRDHKVATNSSYTCNPAFKLWLGLVGPTFQSRQVAAWFDDHMIRASEVDQTVPKNHLPSTELKTYLDWYKVIINNIIQWSEKLT